MSDMGETGTGGNGAAEAAAGAVEQEQQAQGAPDLAAQFADFRTQLGTDFGSRFEALEQRLPPAEQEGGHEEEGEGEDLAPVFEEDDFDERGNLSLEAQTREMNRLIAAQVDARLAPIEQARQQEAWDAYSDALEERYPDLADPAKQGQYIDAAMQKAQALGSPALAQDPHFLEVVYLSSKAEEQARGEIPAGSEREVTIERGSGAGPASPASDTRGDGIVSAMTGSQFRLGRGKGS